MYQGLTQTVIYVIQIRNLNVNYASNKFLQFKILCKLRNLQKYITCELCKLLTKTN